MKIGITGGAGFLGHALIKKLGAKDEILVMNRNESKLIELKNEFPHISYLSGDISDDFMSQRFCTGLDVIYHLASLKHVLVAEQQPYQAVMTNVVGTMNLLKHFKGNQFIAISTDKAAQISGVYGATKYLLEKLMFEYQSVNPDVAYRVVRYGNVLFSSSSVLTRWKYALENGKEVVITDPEATRFYWHVDLAIQHIFDCIKYSKDATPYIPEMKAMRLGDLLEAMQLKYGRAVSVRQIGLQPSENFHETMDGKIFSNEVEKYSIDEILGLI